MLMVLMGLEHRKAETSYQIQKMIRAVLRNQGVMLPKNGLILRLALVYRVEGFGFGVENLGV